MQQRLRLEVNGRQVRNPFVRTVVGVLMTILIAAGLLLLGVILLPIFVAILAIAAVAGGIAFYRVRRFLRQVRREEGFRPEGRSGQGPAGLDPEKEVHITPTRNSPRK